MVEWPSISLATLAATPRTSISVRSVAQILPLTSRDAQKRPSLRRQTEASPWKQTALASGRTLLSTARPVHMRASTTGVGPYADVTYTF